MMQNISPFDRLKAYKNYSLNYIEFFNKYRKRYKNYLTVINHVLRRKYPISAVLKDGKTKFLKAYGEVYADLNTLDYVDDDDIVYFEGLKFFGGKSNGDITNIYVNNQYGRLPVFGKTVIDVGASIGDSAIYFIRRGAKKVIAIEPSEQAYRLAGLNMEANSCSDKIELIRAGISPNTSIDDDSIMMNLSDIVEKYCHNDDTSVLKMDCEGCEYDVIINSPDKTIANFSHIQMEYHYGYRNIKQRLEKLGFHTLATEPIFFRSFNKTSSVASYYKDGGYGVPVDKLFMGMLFAERDNPYA